MLRAIALVLVFCACATPKAAVAPGESCSHAYALCTNACFANPNYRRNDPRCTPLLRGGLCPQQDQLVDTIAAGKCFEECETTKNLCTPPAPVTSAE